MERMDNSEKSLIHISHLHPLKLVASPEPKPICHACNLPCGDHSFRCVDCRYFLHVTCATIKNSMQYHPAHPAHILSFELTPTYNNGKFRCNACGEEGSTFSLRCKECNYDLHLHCAALPHKLDHQSHCHPLFLCYEHPAPHLPYVIGTCELCPAKVDLFKWCYRCNDCNIGGHVPCFAQNTVDVFSPGLQALAPPQQPAQIGSATVNANAQNQVMDVQLQMMQAKAYADLVAGFNLSSFV